MIILSFLQDNFYALRCTRPSQDTAMVSSAFSLLPTSLLGFAVAETSTVGDHPSRPPPSTSPFAPSRSTAPTNSNEGMSAIPDPSTSERKSKSKYLINYECIVGAESCLADGPADRILLLLLLLVLVILHRFFAPP